MTATAGNARARRWAVCLVGVLVLGGVAAVRPAAAERVRLDPAARPRIVNGVNTHAYPSTGALLASPGGPISDDNAGLSCSGTLIGCRTFLVASHCVEDPTPSRYRVYLQHAGLFEVTSVMRHPAYEDATFPIADVAVLTLADWATGIAPTAVNQTDPLPFIPAVGTIVGFGQTQGGGNDYGIKRVGTVQTAACPAGLPAGATDAEVVCWAFETPLGAPGTDSNTCNGDSGGPLFLDLGAGSVVAGVTSGGSSLNCLADDVSYDANVATYAAFVLARLAGDDTATCGGLPAVGTAQTTVTGHAGTLDQGNTSDAWSVTVPAGANALRVALNGEDNGAFAVDLYVKQGSGAGPANFDCKADGAAVFGACVIDHPAAGTWSMAAVRTQGGGEYQLTATVFGGAAPICGDSVRAFDETCDGADADLCAGLCRPDCTCPAPVCGNGVREQGEQCDGAAAGLCPGQCDAACACPAPCSIGDLYDVSARLDAARLKLRARVLNFNGSWDGVDPRDGFRLSLFQAGTTLSMVIPANDPGWSKSKPDKGRYTWTGNVGGITRVKVVDRSARAGIWKVVVVGSAVSGAGNFDLALPIDVRLTMDERCSDDSF
mgnify:CR=1 FL=1